MLKEIRIALIAICLIVALIGCENVNPVSPTDMDEPTRMGELKSDTALTPASSKESGIQILGYKVAEVVMGAPSFVEDEEETGDVLAATHADEPGGSETIDLSLEEGRHIPQGCNVAIFANGKNIGSATAKENMTEATILIPAEDLPDGSVTLVISIVCNDVVAASTALTIERPTISSPADLLLIDSDDDDDEKGGDDEEDDEDFLEIDDVYLGDTLREVILEFENHANAYSSVKENVIIAIDGKEYVIVRYDENGDKVTLILRKDLPAGKKVTVIYNGEGGLEGRPGGEPVEEFEFTFTTPEAEVLTIREAIAARSSTVIPKGLYRSGSTLLTALDHFGYKVSEWSRQILSNPAFPVEKEEGETEVVFVTADDLGLQAGFTGSDVIAATLAAGYTLLPPETGPQERLIYPDQPDNEVVLIVSIPVYNPITKQTYLFFVAREDGVSPGRWITAIEVGSEVGYILFAVGAK